MIVYIDDIMILEETKELVLEALIYFLECLGYIIN